MEQKIHVDMRRKKNEYYILALRWHANRFIDLSERIDSVFAALQQLLDIHVWWVLRTMGDALSNAKLGQIVYI